MRRDHLNALLAQFFVQPIAIVSAVDDEVLRVGLDHVEVEAELYQTSFVMVRGMVLTEIGRPWRTTIAMIFKPFPRLVGPISAPPPLAIAKVASMKHSSSSIAPLSRSSLATSVKMPRSTSLRHQF